VWFITRSYNSCSA